MRGISFEAGGESRILRFDFNALCVLEEKTGKTIDQIGQLLQPEGGGVPRLNDLRLMFWAGLGAKGTLGDVGVIMSEVGFARVTELIMRAFVDAFPQLAEKIADDAPADAGAAESGNGIGAAA